MERFANRHSQPVILRQSWLRRRHHFQKEKFDKDFRAGFRAGYEEVAAGGNGCCPAVPPQNYWSWEFQSAEGRGRTQAWYAGFPHGARAAEEDGVANWNQMPMSIGMQAEYQQAGMPLQEGSIYPIPDPRALAFLMRSPWKEFPSMGPPSHFRVNLPATPNGGQIVP